MKKSRKWSLIGVTVLAVVIAAAWGISTLRGASTSIEPARLATSNAPR